MFHLWHLDINDESVTVRRLWNFFNRLPSTSETIADIQDLSREARTWSPEMYLLANIIDCLQAVDWHVIASASKRPPRPPKPFPRPSTTRVTKKKLWPGKTIVELPSKDKGVS